MKSTTTNPAEFANSVFEKFKNINEKVSELVLDSEEKLNNKTIFIMSQCGAKFFIESLSSELKLSNFDSAMDFEQERLFYEQSANAVKTKRFIDKTQNISSAEIIKEKQVQLELFS